MRADIERWNRKFADAAPLHALTPDPLLQAHEALLTGSGRACDLACGLGHNGLYLADHGYQTYLIDGSARALSLARAFANSHDLTVFPLVADLDRYPLPRDYFDVMVVIRYLNRALIDDLIGALRADGLLFFRTFNQRFLERKPTFPSQYVLAPGELRRWFTAFDCLASDDDPHSTATTSYFVGRKVL